MFINSQMAEMNGKNILVIDDDRKLRKLLTQYLESEEFAVFSAQNAADARLKLADNLPDLIVLDVMMPGEGGLSLASYIKKHHDIPILMLTALGDADNRIKGLEEGADDYLVKPFEPRELVLRIKKLLERKPPEKQQNISIFGNYSFNTENGDLRKDGKIITLSSTEASLLKILALNLNNSVSREEISQKMNGISERSIDVQITRLRKKIEDDPSNPVFIQTARGQGYILMGR